MDKNNFATNYDKKIHDLYSLIRIDGNCLRLKKENWQTILKVSSILEDLEINYDFSFIRDDFFKKEVTIVSFANPKDLQIIKDLLVLENKKIKDKISTASYENKINILAAVFSVTKQGFLETPKYLGKSPEAFFQTDLRFKIAMETLRNLNFSIAEVQQKRNSLLFIPDGEKTQKIIQDILNARINIQLANNKKRTK